LQQIEIQLKIGRKWDFLRSKKVRQLVFKLKANNIHINFDKGLTDFAKILSIQEKTLLGGGIQFSIFLYP